MKKKKYIRDGRAPIPVNEATSKVMSANKGKNTKPEVLLRKALRENGLGGYRLHWKKAPGKPDIAYPGRKVAIFVNGCFWHRCPHCDLPLPKSNQSFWEDKFQKNVERDWIKKRKLEDIGWQVLVIWECEIKQDMDSCIMKVRSIINE